MRFPPRKLGPFFSCATVTACSCGESSRFVICPVPRFGGSTPLRHPNQNKRPAPVCGWYGAISSGQSRYRPKESLAPPAQKVKARRDMQKVQP